QVPLGVYPGRSRRLRQRRGYPASAGGGGYSVLEGRGCPAKSIQSIATEPDRHGPVLAPPGWQLLPDHAGALTTRWQRDRAKAAKITIRWHDLRHTDRLSA